MTPGPARIAAVLTAGLVPLLPACAHPEPHGVVIGLLVEFGGPGPGIRLLVPGHVTATGPAATQTVIADQHGRFRFLLPPGVYRLTGRANNVRCVRVRKVRVREGTVTQGATVTCSVP
jgi:hypothetical protein